MRKILFLMLLSSSVAFAQQETKPLRSSIETDTRAIRQDVPMTNSIRKAFEEGSRNFTGKPGPNYWQLETDFTIKASLDPSTQTITGSEKILIHNNSKEDMTSIVLRLDHNIFRGDVPRGSSVPAENTEGMVVTSIKVGGEAVDLNALPIQRRRNEPAQTPKLSVRGLQSTVATITLADPIKAGATAELEIDWHTKLPGGDNGRGHRMTQRFDSTYFSQLNGSPDWRSLTI
jgi:hypothetical protein